MGHVIKTMGHVVPAVVVDARAEAAALLAAARAEAAAARDDAEAIREQARREGAEQGRAEAVAAAAALLAGARAEATRLLAAARPAAIVLAARMTEKIVGRGVALDPEVMTDIAGAALEACRPRGDWIRVRVHPDDLAGVARGATRSRRAHPRPHHWTWSPTRRWTATAASSRPRSDASTRGSRPRSPRSSARWPRRRRIMAAEFDLERALARLDERPPAAKPGASPRSLASSFARRSPASASASWSRSRPRRPPPAPPPRWTPRSSASAATRSCSCPSASRPGSAPTRW